MTVKASYKNVFHSIIIATTHGLLFQRGKCIADFPKGQNQVDKKDLRPELFPHNDQFDSVYIEITDEHIVIVDCSRKLTKKSRKIIFATEVTKQSHYGRFYS